MTADPWTAVAAAAVAVWIGLTFFRGGFWRFDQRLDEPAVGLAAWPAVVAVMPARNEAPTVRRAAESLLGQDYPGELDVIVVDDGSLDGTAEAARTAAAGPSRRLTVISASPLVPGWTGKLWAMDQGVAAARRIHPRASFILFSDADIVHGPTVIRRLVAKAEVEGLDLVSVMAHLHCRNGWERLLIPAFVFFFQKLFPFPWVNDRRHRTAAAAGGCMMVRVRALAAAGGLAAIRGRLIDDCALGALVKSRGAIWLGVAPDVRSLRRYDRLGEIWSMVARSAFVQLGYSWGALAGTVAGMALAYLVAPTAAALGTLFGRPDVAGLGLAGLAAMAVCYRPTLSAYGLAAWRGLTLPAAGLLYALMTVDSAVRHGFGRYAPWKGRRYGTTTDPRP